MRTACCSGTGTATHVLPNCINGWAAAAGTTGLGGVEGRYQDFTAAELAHSQARPFFCDQVLRSPTRPAPTEDLIRARQKHLVRVAAAICAHQYAGQTPLF